MPFTSTKATGSTAFNCQFTRTPGKFRLASPRDFAIGRFCLDVALCLDSVPSVSALAATFAKSAISGIGVQPGKQVSHSKEREHHNGESEDGKVGRSPSAPPPCHPHVKVAGIYQPGDGRPGFFRIPTPVGAPGAVGPVCAGGDHQGE